MRDFSWKYFMATGTIDAYLLYKEYERIEVSMPQEELISHQEEVAAAEE